MSKYNNSTRKKISVETALMRLEGLCARSEQCETEVRRKLATWQIEAADADAILHSLKSRRYVDDSRYAQAFVRDKYRFSQWGRRKIAMALRQKRIDGDLIDVAIDSINEDEYREILRRVLASKAKNMSRPLSYEDRVRLLRYAVSRGYEASLASEVVKKNI
ncbi:MAG: RecX family transcriptional regulator [Muribaculaceae bacterium]|nr:RecX family transcriptional regulator [Muribaculaceae bacterium]